MDMVAHQHVGMDPAIEACGELRQFVQIAPEILLGVETYGAVIAALDDVPWDAGDTQTGAAGHE